MTPLETQLRAKEASLKHAFEIVDTFDHDGRFEGTTYHHYLTCRKCLLRNQLGMPSQSTEELVKCLTVPGYLMNQGTTQSQKETPKPIDTSKSSP